MMLRRNAVRSLKTMEISVSNVVNSGSIAMLRGKLANVVLSDRTYHSSPIFHKNVPKGVLDKKNGREQRKTEQNVFNVDPASPWRHELLSFDECVSSALKYSTTPLQNTYKRIGNNQLNKNPSFAMFWDSMGRAMELYYSLRESPDFNAYRVSRLIHLLHNGLRSTRDQLVKLSRKPDYDSQSFHKEMMNFLCNSLKDISDDILIGKVSVSGYGATHLLTSFKELSFDDDCIRIWEASKNLSDETTSQAFQEPKVVGFMLPLLYAKTRSLTEPNELYNQIIQSKEFIHPNLYSGLIKVFIKAEDYEKALSLFGQLCEKAEVRNYGYLIETHLSFIGDSKNLTLAESFFDKIINDEMPYKIILQVSTVNSFLQNIWKAQNDFDHVYRIWEKAVKFYGNTVNPGILSSLNNTFFTIFFENYINDNINGFRKLQEIITFYSGVKKIDEPFFNVMLTRASIWHERSIIDFIDKNYTLYHIPRTIISYRILLKSLGSIDNTNNEEILDRWLELVKKLNELGQQYIANADLSALRDATVVWSQSKRDEKVFSAKAKGTPATTTTTEDDIKVPKPLENLKNEDSTSNSEDRIELYLKILKRYTPYFRATKQVYRYTTGCAESYPILNEYLSGYSDLSAEDIPVPQLHSFIAKEQ
ncbi:ANL_collapsed_G0019010.mRNA.1.CDS.1 [Saccharomyces cerevisiae]|uniref:RNA-binding protein RMD9, mitochondrial n=2 Tax=Saccharomyces cerevisiae TaxID=4932 RepID=RMD9_YEAST|eukprot:NP_011408.1 Rmd9p [Saccharomyces cerevisiae S288C]